MTTFFLFVLGACIGSFLNVVAGRWGTRTISGRSECPHCNKVLRWYELVPLVSYIVQRGRCRGCGTKVSIQYPVVELLTGLIFATVPLLMLPVFCIYIVILIYDFHHKIIPDSLVYSAIVISFLYSIYAYYLQSTTYYLPDFLAGPIIFLFFAAIWYFSRGRAMGFGDAKLGASIGFLLGSPISYSAIVLSFWLGLLATLPLLISKRGLTMKSEVPFAPFMILGAWVALVLGIDLLNVSSF